MLGRVPQSFPGLLSSVSGAPAEHAAGSAREGAGPAHEVLAARPSNGHLIPGPSAKASSGQCLSDQVRSMVPAHS